MPRVSLACLALFALGWTTLLAKDPDTKKLWRLVYQVENLRALTRSHRSLPALVNEILSQSVGPYRNALEERHDAYALAELAWSPQSARNWDAFKVRLGAQGPRWTAQNIGPLLSQRRTANGQGVLAVNAGDAVRLGVRLNREAGNANVNAVRCQIAWMAARSAVSPRRSNKAMNCLRNHSWSRRITSVTSIPST